MKKLLFSVAILFNMTAICQTMNDAGRIVLNEIIIDKNNEIPNDAKSMLDSKLKRIATENAMGGNSITPRFVLAAKINIQSKDIIPGPPQMTALNIDINFFIGDVINNTIFSSMVLSVKGVGANENKSMITAFQNINPKNSQFNDFINKGKEKIIEFYSGQCDLITKKAAALSNKQEYDAAIYELMQVPDVCKSCYDKCLNDVNPIFQKKIDKEGLQKLNEAKIVWNAKPNYEGATEAGNLLSNINPLAVAYKEGQSLSESIKKKIFADEKRDWEFNMKKYQDDIKIEQQRIEAAKQSAIEYYRNQPKSIIYNNIIW